MRYLLILCFFVSPLSLSAQWNHETLFPTGGMEGVFCEIVGEKVYMNGGPFYDVLYSYDLETQTWEDVSILPEGIIFEAFSGAIDGALYVFGGNVGLFEPTTACWKYDIETDTWTRLSDLPNGPRLAGFSFTKGSTIYIGGGYDGEGLARDMWAYDTQADSWRFVGVFPVGGIWYAPSFIANGKAYVTTGLLQNEETQFTFEFDFDTESWTRVADFPGHARQAAFALGSGTIGLVGGGNTRHEQSFHDVWAYDALRDSWHAQEHLKIPISNTSWSGAFAYKGNAYVGVGVSVPTYEYTDSIFVAPLQSIVSVENNSSKMNVEFDPVSRSINYTNPQNFDGQVTLELFTLDGRKLQNSAVHAAKNMSVTVAEHIAGVFVVRLLDDNDNVLFAGTILLN